LKILFYKNILKSKEILEHKLTILLKSKD